MTRSSPLLFLGLAAAVLLRIPLAAAHGPSPNADVPTDFTTVTEDNRIELAMHAPAVIMTPCGCEPFLFRSADGTLFCQGLLPDKPFDTKGKMVYAMRIGTVMSRDDGATWTRWTHQVKHDDVNIEGGAGQCVDGTILMVDAFVVPTGRKDYGQVEVWKSHDDIRTLEGPFYVDAYLPQVNWTISTDDGGHPHNALHMHRTLLEMPNRDVLALGYGWFDDDHAPCPYMPAMKKSRVIVIRSRDQGKSWAYLSTVAVDGAVGTEGFDEPVMVRITKGAHAGRLLCLMRTGRDIYQAYSEDAGATWSRAVPVTFPGIDIRDTARWVRLFTNPHAPDYVPSDQMLGVIVDPDLIEMQSGVLVCTIGVRTPEKKCFQNWRSPSQGCYLAFSLDGGESWSKVVRFLTSQPSTGYMAVREINPGVAYVVYDDSFWQPAGRMLGFQLNVTRRD